MSVAYRKPLPVVDSRNRPYWEALRRHELRLPRCAACGTLRFAPFRHCPACGSEDTEWPQLSGRGTIWSRAIFHQVYFEGFRDEAPYNVVLVQLDEGVKLYSNIVGADNAEIRIGRRVEACFDDVTPEVTLLKFRLVD
ncbi:Zn-ribbon domain-containing OB-fold protein [Alsobacter sp. SYSU M60028]|uniref:Zn-ribbon domain-containing OB-fold protein n=1 Tax=Alsobacter ponti TaxID=2962936 RepID=A0ABT1LBA2_9HYPH|nr:Zn-ribbon domain-containing OB-fold protein [Alsobacter ponti]MCP8938762.1 Zn-ribbon domain-containing OB-fold protein [Alsobacter ponti]